MSETKGKPLHLHGGQSGWSSLPELKLPKYEPPCVHEDCSILKDAQRYRWLVGPRSESECSNANVGLMPTIEQDRIVATLACNYMHKEAVDELIDIAMIGSKR